jgi:SOS-response transcriptional repressor LexA
MNKKREKIIAEREKAAFQFIKDFLKKNGFAPNFREIASELNCSVSAGYYTCRNLREKGLINFLEGKNRTIIITAEE